MRFGFAILFAFVGWGCGQNVGSIVSPVVLDPNPATVAGGICSTSATVLAITGRSVTLSTLTARFSGQNSTEATFVLNADDLSGMGDSLVLPGNGVLELDLSFDLGTQGISLPAEGNIVITGTGLEGGTTFVGTLDCE